MLFSTDSLSPRLLRNFERIVVIRLVTRSVTCPKINSTETNFKKIKGFDMKKRKILERELFIELESALKGIERLLSRIYLRNIC